MSDLPNCCISCRVKFGEVERLTAEVIWLTTLLTAIANTYGGVTDATNAMAFLRSKQLAVAAISGSQESIEVQIDGSVRVVEGEPNHAKPKVHRLEDVLDDADSRRGPITENATRGNIKEQRLGSRPSHPPPAPTKDEKGQKT